MFIPGTNSIVLGLHQGVDLQEGEGLLHMEGVLQLEGGTLLVEEDNPQQEEDIHCLVGDLDGSLQGVVALRGGIQVVAVRNGVAGVDDHSNHHQEVELSQDSNENNNIMHYHLNMLNMDAEYGF